MELFRDILIPIDPLSPQLDDYVVNDRVRNVHIAEDSRITWKVRSCKHKAQAGTIATPHQYISKKTKIQARRITERQLEERLGGILGDLQRINDDPNGIHRTLRPLGRGNSPFGVRHGSARAKTGLAFFRSAFALGNREEGVHTVTVTFTRDIWITT
eukprot:1364065-Amorphochlora_amoeboformis.AAC.1